MNLNELKSVVDKMLELFNVREQARVALKQGFFGDIETFEQFCSVKKKGHDEFSNSLERFSWGRCLEKMSGAMWANIFSYAPTNPTADDIVREIYRSIKDDKVESKIIDMILRYDEIFVDELIDRLKFVANIQFPTEQLEWVRYATMHHIPETIDYYTEILQEMKFLWAQVINFAIGDYNIMDQDRKWMSKDDLVQALTNRMEQKKSELEACCRRAEEYSSALAWVEEFEEQEKNPGITMDELERQCDRSVRPIF